MTHTNFPSNFDTSLHMGCGAQSVMRGFAFVLRAYGVGLASEEQKTNALYIVESYFCGMDSAIDAIVAIDTIVNDIRKFVQECKDYELKNLSEEYAERSVDANWALSREGCEMALRISELSKPNNNPMARGCEPWAERNRPRQPITNPLNAQQ